VYVQFEDDGSMVEVLRGQLVPVAGCAPAWHNVGDDGAGIDGLFGLLFHYNTLKFLDFRMLIGRIIKTTISHNFKICQTFILFTGKLE
jgi:hypothetical protein